MSQEPLSDLAKATEEVAKTTGKMVDASREAGRFISRFIAGSLEQGMGIFEDKLKYIRWERQVRLMKKANQLLNEIGLSEPNRAIPMKFAIPLLQAASMEEDDDLQNRWVNLLVNAANQNSGVDIQRAYIDILERLTSLEVKILDVIYSLPFATTQHDGIVTGQLPESATAYQRRNSGKEDLKNPSEEVILALGNLARLGCLKVGGSWGGGEIFTHINPTVLGMKFVEACRIKHS